MTDLDDPAAAFMRAELGDFAASDRLLPRLAESARSHDRAWMLALRAQRWFAQLGAADELPTLGELAEVADGAAAEPLDRAYHALARAAWLALDRDAASACLRAYAAVCGASDRYRLSVAWTEAMTGDRERASEAIEEATTGLGRDDPTLITEAASLRAFGASLSRDLESATHLARRASRMTRTEAFPQEEYLANVVLARVRRLVGKPYLAARILGALDRVAPAPWRAWIGWELGLAGALGALVGPSRGYAARLGDVLRAVDAGDAVSLEATCHALARAVGPRGEIAADVRTLHGLLGLEALGEAPAHVEPWARGAVDEVPDGLHGLGAGEEGNEVAAVVHVRCGGASRRVLRLSRRLLIGRGAVELPLGPARQARTESALAALALAGEDGIDADALFQRLYGFEYRADRHRAVRNTLIHRARSRIGELGRIERIDNVVRLTPKRACILPDPRCAPSSEDALLLAIARWGHVAPKDIASRLGMPLRTAQAVLRRLAEEGVFRIEKDGRAIRYALEDTTFREPTWISARGGG